MSPFIGPPQGAQKLHFPKCEIPNCFLEIEFKLTECHDSKGEESGDEEPKASFVTPSGDHNTQKFEEEISHLREEITQLRNKLSENTKEKE